MPTLYIFFQVRHRFGCVDEIVEIDDQDVRHCNWVRFIRSSTNVDDVNTVATKVRDEPLFQIVKEVPPNGELLVYFDDDVTDRLAARVSSQKTVRRPVLTERTKVGADQYCFFVSDLVKVY